MKEAEDYLMGRHHLHRERDLERQQGSRTGTVPQISVGTSSPSTGSAPQSSSKPLHRLTQSQCPHLQTDELSYLLPPLHPFLVPHLPPPPPIRPLRAEKVSKRQICRILPGSRRGDAI